MELIDRYDFAEMKFTVYFLGYVRPGDGPVPTDKKERISYLFSKEGTIELTHNWGTESDPNFAGYHNGNSDPRGYGHIGITVPDLDAACARFEKMGVEFAKRPKDGKMHCLAFIKDPDGYMIEIFSVSALVAELGK